MASNTEGKRLVVDIVLWERFPESPFPVLFGRVVYKCAGSSDVQFDPGKPQGIYLLRHMTKQRLLAGGNTPRHTAAIKLPSVADKEGFDIEYISQRSHSRGTAATFLEKL